MRELEPALRSGLADLALVLDDGQIALLLDYLALIQKWTQVYNLTAVRDPAEMLTHHLLDSLAVINPLRRQLAGLRDQAAAAAVNVAKLRLLDVGSGGGLPGVVIAICCPEIAVDCVDTVAKKVAFIRQVAATLRLANLRGLHARVESLTDPYRVICSRAFASLADFTRLSSAALAPQGLWLAMKAKDTADEVAALPTTVNVFHVEQLVVPGLDADRCIVWMRQSAQ
ncbi:MAG TPA: 16S rRNA (guanine(527)-N(7))-methyltransferase RsmG [Rhodoferax sp.]